jgi:hypothetical protein
MRRFFVSLPIAALILTGTLAPVAQAQPPFAQQSTAGLSVPISKTVLGQGTFTGTLRITRFAVVEGQAVAVGLVTGSFTAETTGTTTAIVRTVTLPVIRPSATAAATGTTGDVNASAVQATAVCDILNLVLGPLDLNILGLTVHLDTVVLDINAVSGAGNLLGNLLCAITHLLDGVPTTGSLAQLVALLNQLLALLG